MILIVSHESDIHARIVARDLEEDGHEVTIFDTQQLGNGAYIRYSIGSFQDSILCTSQGKEIEACSITSVWYRRPYNVQIPRYVLDTDDRLFAEREWGVAFRAFLCSLSSRVVNPIVAQEAATKPRQLGIARKLQLRIPETLITNDPESAAAFVDKYSGEVIHKVMSAPRHRFMETKKWSPHDNELLADLEITPTLFQELIRGPGDVRATVVGSEIFAAYVATEKGRSAIDSRLDLNVPFTRHVLPYDIQNKILQLMRELDLPFGTVDLKIARNGEYVFLEVNPQGQFLYVEILTEMPIVRAISRLLSAPLQSTEDLPTT